MDDTTEEQQPTEKTYYPNRPLARTAANRAQETYIDQGAYSATVEFEPDKGFVVVLYTENNIPAAWEEGFEVRTREDLARREPTPANWPMGQKKPSGSGVDKGSTSPQAPSKGATARVWAIADDLHEKGPITRADRHKVIQACVDAGINKATASTQWSKWAKSKGL